MENKVEQTVDHATDGHDNQVVSGPKTVRISKQAKPIKYTNLQDFLIKHRTNKKNAAATPPGDGTTVPTHTRIGDEGSGIFGGSYHVGDDEYETFMQLYFGEVVAKGTHEYLTEKQLTEENRQSYGPIAVDLDLHFALEHSERVYSKTHIEDLVDAYLAELKDMYQFDENTRFPVFIFEKDALNPVPEKKMTKDGIHMIIGLQMEHKAQVILRERVIPIVAEMWADFPLINTWPEVFDEGISQGYTNWQLYGSRKPNHEAYKLTHVYEVEYDMDDGEWSRPSGQIADYLTPQNFKKLSVRYTDNLQCFYKSAFMNLLQQTVNGQGANGRRRTASPPLENTSVVQNIFSQLDGDQTTGLRELGRIKTMEELEFYKNQFLDSISARDYHLRAMYEYTMVLPETYYGSGSYAKWIRVGWALRNTSNRLLIVWLVFSAKSPNFQFSNIPDLIDQWSKFNKTASGVSNRSVIYWAMHDNREGFDAVRKNTVSHYLDQTINSITVNTLNNPDRNAKGSGDFDIAVVLHQMFKDEYVCADVKHGLWYRFKNHRWKQIDSGTTLRMAISKQLRDLYEQRAEELNAYKATIDPEDDKYKVITARIETILKIYARLGQTNDKKNIMNEAKDLFYDSDFRSKLDSDPYLLCCKNGVIDFKQKLFRKGLPEDYLTKCTEIDYFPVTSKKHDGVRDQLDAFMSQLFPDESLRKYMWDHLSSVLMGTASVNQTFNNYIGAGNNGKSVLTDLMGKTLGTYKVAAPISIFTQARVKVGGTAPEIVALAGARYVVMQEPGKGDVLHEGPMKEYVSGVEPITARGLYMSDPLVFIPQARFIVCCNEFMGVKSNDEGTWRRIRVVPFVSKFVENPVHDDPDKPHQYKLDRFLTEKFPVWRETFLAMLVERAYLTNGRVEDCDVVMAASNAYRDRQDYLSEFIRDKVVRCVGSNIRKAQLSEEFKIWYNINFGTRNPSPKDLHEYMDKTFGKQRAGVWTGVKLKFNHDDDSDFAEPEFEGMDQDEVELNEL